MRAVHTWRWMSNVHRPWPKRAIHEQRRLSNKRDTLVVASPRPTSPDYHVQAMGDMVSPSLTDC